MFKYLRSIYVILKIHLSIYIKSVHHHILVFTNMSWLYPLFLRDLHKLVPLSYLSSCPVKIPVKLILSYPLILVKLILSFNFDYTLKTLNLIFFMKFWPTLFIVNPTYLSSPEYVHWVYTGKSSIRGCLLFEVQTPLSNEPMLFGSYY